MNLATTTTLASLLPQWLDPEVILRGLGPFVIIGLCLIIFAECGLLIGFFMPGDSLLFTAGLFAAGSDVIDMPVWLLCIVLSACAILGNFVGYGIGYAIGPKMFNKPDSKLFRREYVEKTHVFFEKYGARAIVLARFVPIVRTFITAIAGVGRMEPKRYFTYSIIGGVAWASGVTVLGALLGQFAFVREHIELFLVLIVLVSVIPIIIEFVRNRRERGAALPTGPGDPTDTETTQQIRPVR